MHTNADNKICCQIQNGIKPGETEGERLFYDATEDLTSPDMVINIQLSAGIERHSGRRTQRKNRFALKQIDLITTNHKFKKLVVSQPDKKELPTKNPDTEKRQTDAKIDEVGKNIKSLKNSTTTKPGNSQIIKRSDVAFRLLKEETTLKIDEIINLGWRTRHSIDSSSSPSGEW
ncbi:hypothetical protein JTB14_024654 [Gonioctena quinquepunctata]|nr:hypothetical protein JTB14_024654 [Gonioctena quinquepunctata]